MTNKDKRKYMAQLMTVEAIPALGLWAVLIVLRAFGFLRWHWAVVLSGIVWIPWGMYALTALAIVAVRLWCMLRRRVRRRKVERRIKRQAKAACVWDRPGALGGRALDLYARDVCKLKRFPGESDKKLRARCRMAGVSVPPSKHK